MTGVQPASFDQIVAELHMTGRIDEARDAYRRVLSVQPDHSGAIANLGQILRRQGSKDEALDLYRRAAGLPDVTPEILFNLANAEDDAGNRDAALDALTAALEIRPDMVQALHKRGLILSFQEKWPQAIASLREALRAAPHDVVIRCDLGVALNHDGAPELAEPLFRWAMADQPALARPQRLLADLLARSHRQAEAETLYRGLLGGKEDEKAVTALVDLLVRRHENAEAIDILRQRHGANPADSVIALTLAAVLIRLHQCTEAATLCRQVLDNDPENGQARFLLASALSKLHDNEEALALGRQVVDAGKSGLAAISNLLFTSLYSDALSTEKLADLHREMAAKLPEPADDALRAPAIRREGAALRIGFYSPDLQSIHPVAQFFEPVLANMDRDRFHTTIYSRAQDADETTARFRALARTWRDVDNRSADQIRKSLLADRFDILVDLAGHTGDNGLLFFAQRMAPAQVSYIGYPHSTGLTEMDYIISDAIVTPPAQEPLFTERVLRPNPCLWVFQPPRQAIVRRLRTRSPRSITFGSLNTASKLSDRCLALWARILARCPQADLLLKAGSFADPVAVERFRQRLEAHGADPGRIRFEPPEPFEVALGAYDSIDIVLDTMPFNGGTTTCQALWMGVPVLTRQGTAMCQRMSSSFLTAVGLEELITHSDDAYVELACALAADPARVKRLRRGLSEKVLASAICDAATYTANLQAALIKIASQVRS